MSLLLLDAIQIGQAINIILFENPSVHAPSKRNGWNQQKKFLNFLKRTFIKFQIDKDLRIRIEL